MTEPFDQTRLRPAGRATREAIATAAREMFDEHGYDGASVRAIASRADIDPALVIRHFGSKEELFLEVMQTGDGIQEVLRGPLEAIGRRMVAYFLSDEGEQFRNAFLPLTRAAHHPKIGTELGRRSKELFVDPLVDRLDGEDRELRVLLAGAQMNGLLNALFVQRREELLGASADRIIEIYGDAMQAVLTP
ncbi:TetR family transcriptional regulator [Nocardioides panacisoli]|uniref:TetR/AcrR family transcriptional regulator n=1 Tax=Nocardioides panacisoli TaxID=627624 RepID=UPI001C62A4FA|nr:TetR family transcriptional regulator [Nocardioides panacisoli]QYJ05690.1 TetR family transcriptional regulator [Nocardioides panacisoli]